ncbi:MAG: hypothetical protein PHI67_11655 [Candidatus Methanomethylophilaceae archaeon]|nr:hypothetical protein [Candidatus Methanomethylophilaceae archaeon]
MKPKTEIQIRNNATWLFARLPAAVVTESNRPDIIQPCIGGVEMRVGPDPTDDALREAIGRFEEYLSHIRT